MYDTAPFSPLYGPNAGSAAGSFAASVTIAGTTAAQSAALPGNQTGGNGFRQVQIANTTTSWAYVNFGQTTSNVVAATVAASLPVAPGVTRTVTVASEVCAVSVILGSTPGTNTSIIFTRGNGM